MTRLVRRPVWMDDITSSGFPRRFVYEGSTHRVSEWVDFWEESGAWWEGESGSKMWRVITDRGAALDLEHKDNQWYIYRIWD